MSEDFTLSELDLKATANLRRHGRIVQIGTAGAFDLGFTPTAPNSWPDSPETVWEALDQIRQDVTRMRVQNAYPPPIPRRGEDGRKPLPPS